MIVCLRTQSYVRQDPQGREWSIFNWCENCASHELGASYHVKYRQERGSRAYCRGIIKCLTGVHEFIRDQKDEERRRDWIKDFRNLNYQDISESYKTRS